MGATALVAATSCTIVGPDYRRPDIAMAESFAFAHTNALRQAATDEWWKALGDPSLNRLMEAGLTQNLDVKAAQARILEAEAVLRSAGPYSGLSGDVAVSARRSKTIGTGASFATTSTSQFTPSFVLDIFGGQARTFEQARGLLMAAVYDKAAARLAMQLSVASSYLDMRYFEKALAVQQRSVANKEELVRNIRVRRRSGDATDVELRRAEAELEGTRAQLPVYIAGQRVARLSLAALLGDQGKGVDKLIGKSKGQPIPKTNFSTGFPAELLRNRPDIRAAEARLAAATAAIGVQEAQLFPSLTIGGTVTAATVDSIALTGDIIFPILDAPGRIARRDAARARAMEAEALWRKSVVDAAQEVQIALVRLAQADGEVSAYRRTVASYRETRRLSLEAFELNAVTIIDVLDTEDNLSAAQLNLAAACRDYAQSWAELNVGIGQGWFDERLAAEAREAKAQTRADVDG